MKTFIMSVLIVTVVVLLAALYLLFQPNADYQASQPSSLSRHAAVGRAVIEAARRDPAVAAVVRSAVQGASAEDRALATDLIASPQER